MNPAKALHTFLRRHAEAENARWGEHYVHSGASGRPDSAESRNIYPRYQIHEAMLLALERFDPSGLPPLPLAREDFVTALTAAETPMTLHNRQNPISRAAIEEERSRMIDLARRVSESEFAHVEPMPYRRTLGEDECNQRWEEVATRWGIGRGYWYPLNEPERPGLELVAFETPEFRRDLTPGPLQEILRGFGVRRLYEFREFGLGRELAVEIFDPDYDGEEGYWTARGTEWIIYASHESSLTVGGRELIERVKACWHDWERHVWGVSA
jgi:hypothetical protein